MLQIEEANVSKQTTCFRLVFGAYELVTTVKPYAALDIVAIVRSVDPRTAAWAETSWAETLEASAVKHKLAAVLATVLLQDRGIVVAAKTRSLEWRGRRGQIRQAILLPPYFNPARTILRSKA